MKRALIIATLFVLVPASAQASFPGANGPIAYVSSRGGPPVPMVFDPGDAAPRAVGRAGQVAPAWSPDGAALAVELPPSWNASLAPDQPVDADGQPGEIWRWRPGSAPSELLVKNVDFASPLAWLP